MNISEHLSAFSPEQRAALARKIQRVLDTRRLEDYRPYPKQRAFHDAGALHRERLFRAGNQLGKTVAGAAEAAYHLTGRYPSWWRGRRFDKPTVGWAAGVTGESTRDNPQRLLLGRPGSFGTGMIPGQSIIEHSSARGIADAIDTVSVKHVSGGISTVAFKSYERRREKWQGETLDWIWFDEEPSLDIYTEGLTRTNVGLGPVWITFTPLQGMSSVVSRFMIEKDPGRTEIVMEIGEAEHYTPEQRAAIIASYPEHEREARAKGVPILGSGRVYPVTEESIKVDNIKLQPQWARIAGLDIGWDHPTAVAWLAWDRDADTIYLYDCYRLREETPVIHAAAIRARGDKIPVAWPHDALQRDKGSGDAIAKQYRDQHVNMLPERATFEDGGSGVEAGVMEILDRMKTGRFKVASHLNDWWEEFRLYHRKEGLIVRERDDLMSATRYAVMMRRFARVPGNGSRGPRDVHAGGWLAA